MANSALPARLRLPVLVVDVGQMVLNRPRRDHERLGDVARQAARGEAQHVDLAIGQVGGPRASGTRGAGRFDHRGDGVGIELAFLRLEAQLPRCAV